MKYTLKTRKTHFNKKSSRGKTIFLFITQYTTISFKIILSWFLPLKTVL